MKAPGSRTMLYLAGPMMGLPENNFPAFNAAASLLRSQGWEVVNPVEVGQEFFGNDPSTPPEKYIRADVALILERCSAMALLPGWERSVGARCEAALAVTLGFAFVDPATGRLVDRPSLVIITNGYFGKPSPSLDLLRLESIAWANATFRSASPSSKAEHLRREATELAANPGDLEEMADVFLLLAHLSDGRDLAGAVRAKLEKNRARTWGEPDAHGVVEHIAEGTP